MRYLHTVVRVSDLDESLSFYVGKLGLCELKRYENAQAAAGAVAVDAQPGNVVSYALRP